MCASLLGVNVGRVASSRANAMNLINCWAILQFNRWIILQFNRCMVVFPQFATNRLQVFLGTCLCMAVRRPDCYSYSIETLKLFAEVAVSSELSIYLAKKNSTIYYPGSVTLIQLPKIRFSMPTPRPWSSSWSYVLKFVHTWTYAGKFHHISTKGLI